MMIGSAARSGGAVGANAIIAVAVIGSPYTTRWRSVRIPMHPSFRGKTVAD
jgi:hypothetical protein